VTSTFGDGRYILLAHIAAGGMGIVYKARQMDLDRIVALKMILPAIGASPKRVMRFEREARAAARLHHPHIVPIFEIGKCQGHSYYTMQYAAGGSLAEHRERFANDRAAALLIEKVARAVQYAHENSVLHRDLKPSNILLDEHGEPLVSDFGLAKIWDADVELTRHGEFIGTPAYMAPERANPSPEPLTGAVDVWALGVILYELLAGRRPFRGESSEEVFGQILSPEPPPPVSRIAPIDPRLEHIVMRCLEKEPAARYTAGELANDLASWRGGEPIASSESWRSRAWRACSRQFRQMGMFQILALILLGLILIRLCVPPPPHPPPHFGPPPPWAPGPPPPPAK
jgi:serine/threonine-protein kinase